MKTKQSWAKIQKEFPLLINILKMKLSKEKNYMGLWSIASHITNYYFANFCPLPNQYNLKKDELYVKKGQLVTLEVLEYLSKNYHYLKKPLDLPQVIKKIDKELGIV